MHRQQHSRPLWDELHVWVKLERTLASDGGGIGAACGDSMKHVGALIDDAGAITL